MRKLTNILITGGCGFIGCNFIRMLLEGTPEWSGRIVNLDALTYAGNAESFADIAGKHAGRYVFVHGDIRDKAGLQKIFADYDIDTVVNFAAESHVDRSILGPEAFIQTNVNGTFALL
ncbi:MAG: GDP-mannose 4,6-dehydratase, partial [Spirochaetaceae bacterium]|nr:GDP-mannose 4,6-dehydratase [Spirochaetaceae bacterium]